MGEDLTVFYLISLFPVSRIIVGLAVSFIVLSLRVDRRMPVPDAGQRDKK